MPTSPEYDIHTPDGTRPVKFLPDDLEQMVSDIDAALVTQRDQTADDRARAESAATRAEAVGVTNDGIMAAVAANDDSEFGSVLADKVGTQVADQVPEVLAADPTIRAAAVDAVDGALDDADVITGTDPRSLVVINTDQWVFGILGKKFRMPFGIDRLGRMMFRLHPGSQSADGSLLSDQLVTRGVPARLGAFANDEYAVGSRDASGRVGENALLKNGTVPQWILDRWKTRMGLGRTVVTKTIKQAGGGDYSTIFAAFADAAAHPGTLYRFEVFEGEYRETALLGSAGTLLPPANVLELVARNKRCIIWRTLPDATSNADMAQSDTILVRWSMLFQGFTVYALNIRYVFHTDAGGVNPGAEIVVRRNDLIHLGNTSPNGGGLAQQAIGVGTASGASYLFEDCLLQGQKVSGFMHNREDFAEASSVTYRRCRMVTTSATEVPKVLAQSLGSGQADQLMIESSELQPHTVISHTDMPWISVKPERQVSDHYEIETTIVNSGPVGYESLLRGLALYVVSATSGAASTVRFSGTAAPVLLGQAVQHDGSAGLNGYAYGSLDVSGILVGINQNVTVANTLGRRLGDCTAAPKTLTVTIDGTAHDVLFNANYTASTNATVLALINSAIGAAGVAAEYRVADREHYPQMIGCQSTLRNVTATGIQQWSGLAYSGVGVRLMAPGDPESIFAGVAVEPIPAGKVGRLITDGIFNAGQLQGFPALTAGTPIYHSDTTPGAFALTGGRLASTPTFKGWAPIKGSR